MSGDVMTGAFADGNEWRIFRGYGEPVPVMSAYEKIEREEIFRAITGNYGETSQGGDVFNFTYGPSAGGLTESIKFNIYTYGERILSMVAEPKYKERRIMVTVSDLQTALLRIERFNGMLSPFYSTMMCRSVEMLSGSDQDYALGMTRIIMNEISRILDHISVLAKLAEGASQNVAFNHLFMIRENLYRIVSRRFGHRYFFGINGFSGINRKIEIKGISSEIEKIAREIDDIWEGLEGSRIFLDRIQTTCTIRKGWLLGPAARASGMNIDSRRSSSLLPYSDLDFDIPREENGDSLSRAVVRKKEIVESSRIIAQAENYASNVPESVMPVSENVNGEISVRLENPGGDALFHLRAENGKISRIYVRSPSVQNLLAFCTGIRGNILTDFVFGFESFGVHVSELGGLL
ncbi:MAG: hypothetical protein M1149_00385 [Candidatus Thermoplasmatota archaeon]|jgi:Ni,Fe-hydrogenase III large subunit|nr:hypothetical protein [Candidatus Thermoplasmatota archaeon]